MFVHQPPSIFFNLCRDTDVAFTTYYKQSVFTCRFLRFCLRWTKSFGGPLSTDGLIFRSCEKRGRGWIRVLTQLGTHSVSVLLQFLLVQPSLQRSAGRWQYSAVPSSSRASHLFIESTKRSTCALCKHSFHGTAVYITIFIHSSITLILSNNPFSVIGQFMSLYILSITI